MIIIITHAPDPHTENKRNQTHPIHQRDSHGYASSIIVKSVSNMKHMV